MSIASQSPVGLVAELRGRGVLIAVSGDVLDVDAPEGMLTQNVIDALKQAKPQIVPLLRDPDTDAYLRELGKELDEEIPAAYDAMIVSAYRAAVAGEMPQGVRVSLGPGRGTNDPSGAVLYCVERCRKARERYGENYRKQCSAADRAARDFETLAAWWSEWQKGKPSEGCCKPPRRCA